MPAGYTEIRYGDVFLQNCLTKMFDQTPVWDTDGVTLKYHRFLVTVQGYFTSGVGQSSTVEIESFPRSGGVTAAMRYTWLNEQLTRRAQRFQMSVGVGGPVPQAILYAEPVPDADPGQIAGPDDLNFYRDRNAGPVTKNLSIEHIAGNETFRVHCTFEICIRPPCNFPGVSASENDIYAQVGYGVLSNRWQSVDDINEQQAVTRTYRGSIALSQPSLSPHEFRLLALPPLEPGMKRVAMNFSAERSGLRLDYMIQDKEMTVAPIGMGTAENDGTAITVSQTDHVGRLGTNVVTQLDIGLKGTVRGDRQKLIRMAAVYADAKLALNTFVRPLAKQEDDNSRKVLVESYVMQEKYGSDQTNEVRLSIRIRRLPDKNAGGFAGMFQRVQENFGNEVQGADLAASTNNEEMKQFLGAYNKYRSWGNRIWGGAIENENTVANGTHSITGLLAARLQTQCTLDFSTCSGLTPNTARYLQLRNSHELTYNGGETCADQPNLQYNEYRKLPEMSADDLSVKTKEHVYQTYKIQSNQRVKDMFAGIPVARPVDERYSTGEDPPTPPIIPENANTQFLRLAPQQTEKVVIIEATRWGAAPELPPPYTQFTDSDGVQYGLVYKDIQTPAPELTGNMDMRIYRIRAEYHYVLSHTPRKYYSGTPEYEVIDNDDLTPFVLPESELYKGYDPGH